jgi:hypothetical protein
MVDANGGLTVAAEAALAAPEEYITFTISAITPEAGGAVGDLFAGTFQVRGELSCNQNKMRSDRPAICLCG